MRKNWHNRVAVTLVILFGAVLFYSGTDGFHAFTTKSANEYQLQNSKLALPAVTLQDSQGREFRLDQFAKGKSAFLSFIYTSCGTVCPEIEFNMAKNLPLTASPNTKRQNQTSQNSGNVTTTIIKNRRVI